MTTKKLAILASHPIQYQAGLFRRLASTAGVDLTVYFCWDFGVDAPGYDRDFEQYVQWDIPTLDGYRHVLLRNYALRPGPQFLGQINPGVFKVLRANRYDALVVQGYATLSTWMAIAAARATATPVLIRGESDLLRARPAWKRAAKAPILKAFMRSIDGALYSCTTNREYFRHYGVPDHSLFFFPCAVDNAFWAEQVDRWMPHRLDTKRSLGLPATARVVLAVGKLTPTKRPFDVLRAVSRLPESDWLLFVGGGALREELTTEAARLGMHRVVFTGFQNQSELGRYFAAADVVVVASEHDKSPKALNEAMNFGLPIVASQSVSTARDLVHDGENGRQYPTGDVDALTHAIASVLNHPDRAGLGARSREIVARWTFDADIAGLLEAIDACGARKARALAAAERVRIG